MIIEFARNVAGVTDAAHAEYDPYTSNLIVTPPACSLAGKQMEVDLLPGSLAANRYWNVVDACKAVKAKLSLSERTYRCEHCGLVADQALNAAANLASLVESVTTIGTAAAAGTGRGKLPVNAQGEERFMGPPRCSSTNCENGTSAELDKTVTATRQQVAPKPVLVGIDCSHD
jgi:hypothetical protein